MSSAKIRDALSLTKSGSSIFRDFNFEGYGNRSKPNIRWNGQSTRTKIDQLNNYESRTVKRPVVPPNSQEDIFLDLSKNDDCDDQEDGFTSSSDDCISLSVLLEE
ncbi:hypothetical protein ACTXT7_009573 [Hymenolepis weldensis]